MMTAAALCGVFRVHPPGENNAAVMNEEGSGERFLKELGDLLCAAATSSPKKTINCADAIVNNEKDSLADKENMQIPPNTENLIQDRDTTETPSVPDLNSSATRIQTQVRRYLLQRHYRIRLLQERLEEIDQERQRALAQINRRTQRKLARIRRKHDLQGAKLEREYQKVTGIVQYLKRNQIQHRKELENHKRLCRDLKAENQRLALTKERALQADQSKQEEVDRLCSSNQRLQATLLVQKEAIHLFGILVQEEQQSATGVVSTTPRPTSRVAPRRHSKPKGYETSIKVNCVNEKEEKCFHYRLVQDVYTLTTRSG